MSSINWRRCNFNATMPLDFLRGIPLYFLFIFNEIFRMFNFQVVQDQVVNVLVDVFTYTICLL